MSDRRELAAELSVHSWHRRATPRAQSDGWHGPKRGRGMSAHPPAAAEPSEVSG
jgi:hypothetical protein